MRVLVTGATGCVGANVAAALCEAGYTVRALHRPTSTMEALAGLDVEPIEGDLFDLPALQRAMTDCALVFHVAAVSDYWRTPTETIYRVNVEGTRQVVSAAQHARVERLVYTSSVGALGVPPAGRMLDERDTFNLPPQRFPYGHSKHLAEEVVRAAVSQGLDAVIVNPAAVIGPRDIHWIGGSLLREVQRGQGWFAPPGGTCWAAASDVGKGHLLAALHGRKGERYILGGENITHRRMLEIVAEVVGQRPPWVTLPRWLMDPLALLVRGLSRLRPHLLPLSAEQVWLSARQVYCDSRRAREELGYTTIPLHTAVEQAYGWYRERGLLE